MPAQYSRSERSASDADSTSQVEMNQTKTEVASTKSESVADTGCKLPDRDVAIQTPVNICKSDHDDHVDGSSRSATDGAGSCQDKQDALASSQPTTRYNYDEGWLKPLPTFTQKLASTPAMSAEQALDWLNEALEGATPRRHPIPPTTVRFWVPAMVAQAQAGKVARFLLTHVCQDGEAKPKKVGVQPDAHRAGMVAFDVVWHSRASAVAAASKQSAVFEGQTLEVEFVFFPDLVLLSVDVTNSDYEFPEDAFAAVQLEMDLTWAGAIVAAFYEELDEDVFFTRLTLIYYLAGIDGLVYPAVRAHLAQAGYSNKIDLGDGAGVANLHFKAGKTWLS